MLGNSIVFKNLANGLMGGATRDDQNREENNRGRLGQIPV